MKREALWKTLDAATDELEAAWTDYQRAPDLSSIREVNKAIAAYVSALEPVIGQTSAFRFEAAYHRLAETLERRSSFRASLTARGTDEHDAVMLESLATDVEVALSALDQAEVETTKALEAAYNLDGEEGK